MKLPELGKLLMFLVFAGITLFVIFLIFRKTTEGFYPVDDSRIQYGEAGKQRYNSLSDTQDPFNVFGIIPLDGTGQTIVDGVLQTATYDSSGLNVPRGSGMDIRFDNPKDYTPLPVDKELLRRIKLCEAVKDWTCESFNDPEFDKYCGICIDKGETSRGEHIKFGGLYIDPQLRAETVADAKAAGKSPEIVPSVGKCSADKFILYRPDCDYRKDRWQCSQANSFKDAHALEKCVQCFQPPTGKPTFVYVGKRGNKASNYAQQQKPYKFDVRLRMVTSLGNPRIILIRTDTGAKVLGNKLQDLEFEFIIKDAYENEPYLLSVEYESFKPHVFDSGEKDAISSILLDDNSALNEVQKNNNATQAICTIDPNRVFTLANDDTLVYGCGKEKCCDRILPDFRRKFGIVGQFESVKNKTRTQAFDSSILSINGLAINPDNGPPRLGTISGSPGFSKLISTKYTSNLPKNRFWVWDSDEYKTKAVFSLLMPVSFLEVAFPEDSNLCPTGPLVSTVEADARLRLGACDKLINGQEQGPGTYTDACIKSLFIEAGCKKEGHGFPNSKGKIDELSFTLDSQKNKVPNSAEDIINTVQAQNEIAETPVGQGIDLKKLQDANMYCFGKYEFNPCKGPMETTGPQTVECLDFLFRNAGKTTKGVGPTYQQTSNRSSGTGRVPGKPIEYCQGKGALSPMNENGQANMNAIIKANSLGSVERIRNYYDSVHTSANYSLLKDEQYRAMSECYGVTINKDTSCAQGSALEEPTKIPDGTTFRIVPSLSPGSKIINLMGALIGQSNVPESYLNNALFVSKELEEGTIQIMSKFGPPNNAMITIDGFKLRLLSDDKSFNFKQNSSWTVIDSVAGNPGEVSFESASKKGFYIYFNMLDRTLSLTNTLTDKRGFSFAIM